MTCTTCIHARISRNPNGTVSADCGVIASQIICEQCREPSPLRDWFASELRSGSGLPKCPGCGHKQRVTGGDDWRRGWVGTFKAGKVIPKPEWCKWWVRDESADVEPEADRGRQRELF